MKRVSLVLDLSLLKEAKRELGLRTYSATINAMLKEEVRCLRVRELADYVGKVKWIGDLSQMRGGVPRRRAPRKRRTKQ